MTEGEIDNLPLRNYKRKPRREMKFVGEKAAIRYVDPRDRKDLQRYRGIQEVLSEEFTDTDSTDEELIEEARDTRPGYDHSREAVYTFAVSGSKEVECIKNKDIAEMQGWINFYRDEYVSQLLEKGKIQKVSNRNIILNVAFARHPNALPGQMASALRQACTYLSQVEAGRQDQIESLRNRRSRKLGPELVITAYAGNPKSEAVLQQSGFIDKGPIKLWYEPEKKNYSYKLYVLDWKKQSKIMHQLADEKIHPKTIES